MDYEAYWVIRGTALIEMLREVEAGADPDLVYIEHYANSEHGDVQ